MTSLCHLGDMNIIRQLIPRRGPDEAATSQDDDYRLLDALRLIKPLHVVIPTVLTTTLGEHRTKYRHASSGDIIANDNVP